MKSPFRKIVCFAVGMLWVGVAQAADTVWVEDALPNGAGGIGAGDGDAWNWVSSNPTPYSGTLAHKSNNVSGYHSHWWGWGDGMTVATGDTLFVYVYLDPITPPSEIMVMWSTNTSWEHRAYWGANLITLGTDGTASRYYAGPLPATGGWHRLEVPASAVGMEGETATAMNFALYDGVVTWDRAGKSTGSSPPPEWVWVEDSLPNGAGGIGAGDGDAWNWVSSNPTPYSGTLAHKSNNVSGYHSHWWGWGDGMTVATGDTLFVYVYLDPITPPSEIMVMWSTNTSWEHRAYWGANLITLGTDGTASRYYAGPLPATGGWHRLEVPASAVGMEGETATAMNFALYNGVVTWDRAGKY